MNIRSPAPTSLSIPKFDLSSSTSPSSTLSNASIINKQNTKPVSFNFSDFEFKVTLGTGTFGRVYLCRHKSTNTFFAMKMLKKSEVVRLKQVEHINSERQILSIINHPFVVNLLCTFQDERNLYMLLEYIIGGELFSHLRRAGKFTNEVSRFYAAEITSAIEYMHSYDIVYRDLKPENLLIDSQGHIKITDFGFAKKVTDRTWTLCGTPEYLAPEIIQSRGHGKAVDWWALGILIYEMLAGYPPFYDEHPFGIYEKILAGKFSFPGHIEPNAKDIVKKFLTTDTSKRLGNLKGGDREVRMHKWFDGLDWEKLIRKELPVPFIPAQLHPGDSTNFDKYDEWDLQEEMKVTGEDPYKNLFKGF